MFEQHNSNDRDMKPIKRKALPIPKIIKKFCMPSQATVKSGLHKKIVIIPTLNISGKDVLGPKALKLYHVSNTLTETARRMRYGIIRNVDRIKAAIEYSKTEEFYKIRVNSDIAAYLCKYQTKMVGLPAGGKTYTKNEKILALYLIKLNPRSYRLLNIIYDLPSRKSLLKVVDSLQYACGINELVLSSLQTTVQGLPTIDRHCTLMFEEMRLEACLTYNKNTDSIDGFVRSIQPDDIGFADHVMVFMARGLSANWMQPVAYFFTERRMTSEDLVLHLRSTIITLRHIGLKVVATVCDHMRRNVDSINELQNSTEEYYKLHGLEYKGEGFMIEENRECIIPIYDPPRLLKSLRNDLMKYNAKFQRKGVNRIASWANIIHIYKVNGNEKYKKLMSKIKARHIFEQNVNVKEAAELFSRFVSAIMRYLANIEFLPNSAIGTADFLMFGNDLFDSVNSSKVITTVYDTQTPSLRTPISTGTMHWGFWKEAMKVLESMKFLTDDGKEHNSRTVVHWMKTLKGFEAVWRIVSSNGFESLVARKLNLDSVEHFFGCIRSHGDHIINPTPNVFVASFKSCILNNAIAAKTHIRSEKDKENTLNTLTSFITDENEEKTVNIPRLILPSCFEYMRPTPFLMKENIIAARLMEKKALKLVVNCLKCKKFLYSTIWGNDKKSLLVHSTKFMTLFFHCKSIFDFYIEKYCNKPHLKQMLIDVTIRETRERCFCTQHDLIENLIIKFIETFIYLWVNKLNKILNNKLSADKRDDFICKLASSRYV